VTVEKFVVKLIIIIQWRIQDLPKGGADHGEHAECQPKRGSGCRASGVQGQSPLWGVTGANPPEAESFLFIFHTKSGHLRI